MAHPSRSPRLRRPRLISALAVSTALVFGIAACTSPAGSGQASAAAPAAAAPALASVHGTGLVPDEFGAIAPPVSLRALKTNVVADPPATADLTAWAPPAGDQGPVGSCVAWSVAYTSMGWYQRYNKIGGGALAPMYTYAQLAKGRDTGSSFTGNLNIAVSQGVDTMADYTQGNFDYTSQPTAPETANAAKWKLTGYTALPLTQTAIKTSIAAKHPVTIGMAVYNNFFGVRSADHGFYDAVSGSFAGYHAITALGYDTRGLRIENSWGAGWGDNGFATLSWAFVAAHVFSAIEVGPFTPAAPAQAAPVVTSLSAVTAAPAGGSKINIIGTGFTGATVVNFGTTPATTFSVNYTGTLISATVPAHAAGSVNVAVTTGVATSTVGSSSAFSYQAAPTVKTMTPAIGVIKGGTKVTITGTNLAGATVSFGSTKVTGTLDSAGTTLSVGAPAGTSPVTVSVATAGGTASAGTFSFAGTPVITSLSVSSGPAAGGTEVTITGTDLAVGTVTVLVGSKSVTPTVASSATGKSLVFRTPSGTRGNVSLSVKTNLGTSPAKVWAYL